MKAQALTKFRIFRAFLFLVFVIISILQYFILTQSEAFAFVRNLHGHEDDMDVFVTKRAVQGDLSGLKIWRENGMMKASFLITNNRSEPINLLIVESWTDQAGNPINSRMDEQTVVIAASRTQTILISAPVPQARNAVIELVAGR
jgi:uncharacterized protein YcfL